MKENLSLPEAAYAAEASYNQEFNGRAFDELIMQLDANVSASGGTVTPHENGAARLMGVPELIQAENTLIRADAIDLWHGAAFFNGGYPDRVQSGAITTGNNEDQVAQFRLKLPRVIPGMMVNANDQKAFVRGNFGTLASFAGSGGANVSAVAGTLRPQVVSTMRDANNGFLRPKITQAEKAIDTVSDAIPYTIHFSQDTVVRGISVRVHDSSTDTDVDGLLRGIRGYVTDKRGSNDFIRARWGTIRRRTQALAGWTQNDYDRSTGWAFIPFTDEAQPQLGGAHLFKQNDTLTLEFNTSKTVERGYTAVGAASGDKVFVTIWGGTPVAASGDTGPQLRTVNGGRVRRR